VLYLQVALILEILIRKCGFDAVNLNTPEKFKAFIRSVEEVRFPLVLCYWHFCGTTYICFHPFMAFFEFYSCNDLVCHIYTLVTPDLFGMFAKLCWANFLCPAMLSLQLFGSLPILPSHLVVMLRHVFTPNEL
jgi:hypothetical protein